MVEPLEGGYTYVRNRQGVLPYAHLLVQVAANSAVLTVCGKMGTKISNVGVTTMIRCPECDIGAQLI